MVAKRGLTNRVNVHTPVWKSLKHSTTEFQLIWQNMYMYACIMYFTGWQKKEKMTPKKVHHRTDFEANLWPETAGDLF